MKDFLNTLYIVFLFLGFFSIIYQIYNYGIKGYMERRAERKKQRIDRLNNIIQNNF